MPENSIGYSRAGDVFHYRWAARRALRLLYPKSTLIAVYIEGSPEEKKEGESVIDVTEEHKQEGIRSIEYFQLKHTSTQNDSTFTVSDLKDTIVGFSKRYIQHFGKGVVPLNVSTVSFTVITNRKIDDTFKSNIAKLGKGETLNQRAQATIENYTNLKSEQLRQFCSLIHLEDGHGDYEVQKQELQKELGRLFASEVDSQHIVNIVALVQEKVLPRSDGKITKEDILDRFGISNERQLYPAPAQWENLNKVIKRVAHQDLRKQVSNSLYPVIIHAAGGVGKSVFCRQFVEETENGSLSISYDCFGSGTYRNRSTQRHRHRDALVQIANELAIKGWCDPLIVENSSLDDEITRKFLKRLRDSIAALKKVNAEAKLYILIDAADNAEMAAQEFNQECFAHELLAESFPDDCKLIMLCRTERIHLLRPKSYVLQLELPSFSTEETFENLSSYFPDCTQQDGEEFHKLTNGNPRVQANALDTKCNKVHDLLETFGPGGMSVEDTIRAQLDQAVNKLKDLYPSAVNKQIEAICTGLASLPPHIPISILSKAAVVDVDTVKSFLADFGRALWPLEPLIQFRDEPTETWFREKYCATKRQLENYIAILEPLARTETYVAETLPQLYLQAEQYEKLIQIALSDNLLPENNPIDARNVRVYRLQFAFKAALKLGNFKDAIQVAIRAGEEVAGDQRQLLLLKQNIDLLVPLQSRAKVKEIAYRSLLKGQWKGSENVYSASLLSGIEEYKGEGRSYLRAAMNWLVIYFDEIRARNERHFQNKLDDDELLELAYAHLNIYGVDAAMRFFNWLTPKEAMIPIMQNLIRRLIDAGSFDVINDFLVYCERDVYFNPAIVAAMMETGYYPQAAQIKSCLILLTNSRTRGKAATRFKYEDKIRPTIISFLEACLHNKLSSALILRALRYFMPEKASSDIITYYDGKERALFLRALAIRSVVAGMSDVNYEEILPEKKKKDSDRYDREDDYIKYKEYIGGLFPWYLLRTKLISGEEVDLIDNAKSANEKSIKARSNRYVSNDTLPNEIASVSLLLLFHAKFSSQTAISSYYSTYLKHTKELFLSERINGVRAAFRLPHLEIIKKEIEQECYQVIRSIKDGPENIANRYIDLARAIVISSKTDAHAYFEEAIKIVSKFGDELNERWFAIICIAGKATENGPLSDQLGYRFIRAAEIVGENTEEKYWDRNNAIAVCAQISPGAGVSAISRWRDRDIGYFDGMLERLLSSLIEKQVVEAEIAWSLRKFILSPYLNEFVEVCLKSEPSIQIRTQIVCEAVTVLRLQGSGGNYLEELKELADTYGVVNTELNDIVLTHQKSRPPKSKDYYPQNVQNDSFKWEKIFNGIDLENAESIENAYKKALAAESISEYGVRHGFWKEVFNRIDEDSIGRIIEAFLNSDLGNIYEAREFFTCIPIEWKNKISFKNKWPGVVFEIGKKYAYDLTGKHALTYFIQGIGIEEEYIPRLNEGIFDRLANGNEFNDASIFFEFVALASQKLTTNEAAELLDYSLKRMEMHIEDDFGDGPWADWLQVSEDINQNIALFLWASLASPRTAFRWSAAHCVRSLFTYNATGVIEKLIQCLENNTAGAFGSKNFPFYYLHAQLYLLIALSRASAEYPEQLREHSTLFIKYALTPHVLIQQFASNIIVNIESKFPGTYDSEIYNQVVSANKSQFPILNVGYEYATDSVWHIHNQIEKNDNYSFGWDFDHYWFAPLGNVFGIPEKQVADLAADILKNEWNVTAEQNGYNNDPRTVLWNNHHSGRETWHDHGDYPKADNLDFYNSYHSMFVVAAKLLQRMQVLSTRDEEGDRWQDWLSYHILTRTDGKWLADIRNKAPFDRPDWTMQKFHGDSLKKDEWRKGLTSENFWYALLSKIKDEHFVTVKGSWHEISEHRKETYTVSSALVCKQASSALLLALTNCKDPYDYKLPHYDEENMEIDEAPFFLKGWIDELYKAKGIDKFDPYANEIDYPPHSIGEEICEKLGLTLDADGKIYHFSNNTHIAVMSELWNSRKDYTEEESEQSGNRAKASLSFLKYLCKILDCELIFDVGITRDFIYPYRDKGEEYMKAIHKIFILSEDGQLTELGASVQIG